MKTDNKEREPHKESINIRSFSLVVWPDEPPDIHVCKKCSDFAKNGPTIFNFYDKWSEMGLESTNFDENRWK